MMVLRCTRAIRLSAVLTDCFGYVHLVTGVVLRFAVLAGFSPVVLTGCVGDAGPQIAAPASRTAATVLSVCYELQPAAAVSLLSALDQQHSATAEMPEVLAASVVGDESSPTEQLQDTSFAKAEMIRLQVTPAGKGDVRALALLMHSGRTIAAYELMLSAAELELLVAGLRSSGFFETPCRPNGNATIEIGYGDQVISKDWTPEPRFDDIAERVLSTGRRVPLDQRPVTGQASVVS